MVDEVLIPPTGDELQAKTVKKLPDSEREAADKAAKAARKEAKVKHHADRIAAGTAHNVAQATKLWVGAREVTIERPAAEDDIGYIEDEACSVVKFTDTGEESVVLDSSILTTKGGTPPVFSH